MVDLMIETIDLTKTYKLKGKDQHIQALNNVNLSIKEGEIFGLLGPNGAGKTTLIEILTTLLQPTSGHVILDGINIHKHPAQAKSRLALMLGSDGLYYRLSAYANLKFFAKIYKVHNFKDKVNNLMAEFGLEKWLYQYVENFSSGMKMKLALVKTLLLDRRILFLDEPTLGLDVKSISFIIKKLKEVNSTIFMTSHDMSVVEKLCDRIAFINKGDILKIGTQEDIKKLEQTEIFIDAELNIDVNNLKNELETLSFIKEIFDSKKGLIIGLKERKYYRDLLAILSKYEIQKVKELDISLEELFIKLM